MGGDAQEIRHRIFRDYVPVLLERGGVEIEEGFDAGGDTLRCVVIPKLPFASPRDPLVRERELREDRSWWRHSLPEAVISVKQAAGRLIRTSTDAGVLVLADSRLVSKRYGRQFVGSLPSKSVATLEAANVRRYIEMWRSSRGV